MNYKVLLDGAITGYNAGDIIDLSESDGNSLSQWGIVEAAPANMTVPTPSPAVDVSTAPSKEVAAKVAETKVADKAKVIDTTKTNIADKAE